MVLFARLLEPLYGHQLPSSLVPAPENGPIGALAELAELLVGLIVELGKTRRGGGTGQRKEKTLERVKTAAEAAAAKGQ